MTTASHALEFVTGDIAIRPGFAGRLANWIKSRRAAAETPSFDTCTRYNQGLSDAADESKLQSVAELEPHIVMGRMMWVGVR
jgi:hypothetical protein